MGKRIITKMKHREHDHGDEAQNNHSDGEQSCLMIQLNQIRQSGYGGIL